MFIPKKKQSGTLHIPHNIPRECWCDFRKDYETGMTLKEIGEKYHCDPRTVRHCIIQNRSSDRLGRKSTPSILQNYEASIQELIGICLTTDPEVFSSVYSLSCHITQELLTKGYRGSERTVRNYLNTLPSIKAHYEKEHLRRSTSC